MTKTDLIIALGKIDEKYINKAFEKAAESDCIFDDNETQEKVGIMDKKKYIKSKIVPIATVAASVMLCVGTLIYITLRNNDDKITLQDNSAVTSQTEQSDSSTDNSENNPVCDYVVIEPYKTYDDAVEQFLLDAQQNNDDLPYSAQVNGVDGVYIYSLKNLPEGYNEEDVYDVEDIHYYNDQYNNADSNEQALKHLVIFNWYNNKSFEDTIKGIARSCISNGTKFYPVKNIPNCYCAVYGSYQEFYWENDGYCFNLRLPTYIGSISTARFEYSGQNVFELKKTFYAFDNSVEIAVEPPASEEKYKCCDIEEVAPIDDGENLHFGARVTAWHPWDCDFALQVSVHNAANTTSLANFVLTDWAENLSFGESAELQVTFGVDEIPENTTISCKVITYYKVDDAEHEGISKYLGSHSYKKQNHELDGITITTEMLNQFQSKPAS